MPTPLDYFVSKWNASTLTEKAAAQQHFRDLCEVLAVPCPTQDDEIGASYTFEKRVAKAGTGEIGFADVWKRGFFAWEYKSKGGDLKQAYKQLNEYHESLDNPPLLVVCDFVRFEVHTKFENAPPRIFAFTLDGLLSPSDTPTCALPPLQVLRHVFGDFNKLRPEVVAIPVTRAAAADFLRLAQRLEVERALTPQPPTKQAIAHFLMRLVFCLFADSVELLPDSTFRRLVRNHRHSPISFNRALPLLFQAMSQPDSFFGPANIPYFNGGLFKDDATIPLEHADLGILSAAAHHDWSHIEPAIFGTLFERSLDSAKRSMIGAHYTSPDDILLLIEPVIMAPLLRRWEQVRQSVLEALAAKPNSETSAEGAPGVSSSRTLRGAEGDASASRPATPPSAEGAPGISSSRTLRGAEEVGSASRPATPLSAEGAPLSQPGAQPQDAAERNPKGLKARPNPAPQPSLRLHRHALTLLQGWASELTRVRILDPACGSGNFLYLALKRLLDLWQTARQFGLDHGLSLALEPIPSPTQLYGIEIDFYAHEIASIVVWIGFLQWKRDHANESGKEPLLQPLSNIQHADAILRFDAQGKPFEPEWPEAEFIVGNPPFLGGKLLRRELGDTYVDSLFDLYRGRVKAESDLVVYWFEKARRQLEIGRVARAGLLATQGIRGGANRAVLERIQQTGTIFWAWSDRKWTLQGAAVHVSMVAFERTHAPTTRTHEVAMPTDFLSSRSAAEGSASRPAPNLGVPHLAFEMWDGATPEILLNGEPVSFINPDLTTGSNTASAKRLQENDGICFMGTTRIGAFDIDPETARKLLAAPQNPNGRTNEDVIKPWINATDLTGRPRGRYIIDFGIATDQKQAALYEQPFEYIRHKVRPIRVKNRRGAYAGKWWIFGEPRSALRQAVANMPRFIATPMVSKHRIFTWQPSSVVAENLVNVIARDDDYFFGVLHCSIHELWARAQGTQLREVESGFRYTPKTTFDTFPFPWPPGAEPSEADSTIVRAIAEAARTLVRLRDHWLNPPGASPEELRKRTLTNLYNQRPTWLADAHRTLDEAVFAAYGWPYPLATQQILARLLALNHQRATPST